jgi:putative endonuclease
MTYFVYLLITKSKNKVLSYVGYTNNVNNRLKLHNASKGAKFTRGRKWELIYKKKYNTKSEALIEEYRLKKNYKKRNQIKNKFFKKKD